MKVILNDLLIKCQENVDKEKLDIITTYLTSCVAEGILKSTSPQFVMLLGQAMIISKTVK